MNSPHHKAILNVPLSEKERRIMRLPEKRTDKPKLRRCLTCALEFKSTWAGHRVCGTCHELRMWQPAGLAGTMDDSIGPAEVVK